MTDAKSKYEQLNMSGPNIRNTELGNSKYPLVL